MKVLSFGYEIEINIFRATPEESYTIASYVNALEKGLIAKAQEEIAYIKLSNLYLALERGSIEMSQEHKKALKLFLDAAYPHTEGEYKNTFENVMQMEIYRHWLSEFKKLPNW